MGRIYRRVNDGKKEVIAVEGRGREGGMEGDEGKVRGRLSELCIIVVMLACLHE